MKIVPIGMQIILDGLYKCQDEGFELTMSSDLSCKWFPVLISYCCIIAEREGVPGAWDYG